MPHAPSLPGPGSRPEADVVIYDGQCQFCQSQVRRLAWLDSVGRLWGGGGRLAYLSLHDPQVAARFPDLTHDMLMEQMYVVDAQGRRHGGADALRYLSRRLPVLWPAMPILHLPGSARLWRKLYGAIARQRYRWNKPACDGDACTVHFGRQPSTDENPQPPSAKPSERTVP